MHNLAESSTPPESILFLTSILDFLSLLLLLLLFFVVVVAAAAFAPRICLLSLFDAGLMHMHAGYIERRPET